LTGPDGCLFSQEYELKIPPYYAQDTVVICELDYYLFGNDSLTVSGAYERLIAATDGCDSIIQLWVDVLPNSFYELHDTICKGEIYNLYDISTSEAGIHEIILPNAVGCDSIISLTLSIANEDLSLELEADKKIVMGKKLDIVPAFAHPAIVDFIWTNDSGSILSTDIMLSDYRPLETTTLFLEGTDIYGCKTTDSMQIEVLAVYNLYIPNAFSPDGDAVNDYFTLYPSLAVEKVNVFQVYDRWGTLVFEDKTIDDIHDFEGWDGTKSGDPLNPGIYSYLIEVQFLDGMRKIIKGDIALLR
jgi:gliding motility-associated-like protein